MSKRRVETIIETIIREKLPHLCKISQDILQ